MIMEGTRTEACPPAPRHAQMHCTPTWKDRPLDDDIVPSLPPGWQPPPFSTQEVQSSRSSSSDEEEVTEGIVM